MNDVGWNCPTCGLRREAYEISHSSGMLKNSLICKVFRGEEAKDAL